MDASKLTSRSVEVINAAQPLAVTEGNPQIEPVHLPSRCCARSRASRPRCSRRPAPTPSRRRALDQALWTSPEGVRLDRADGRGLRRH